MTDARGSTSDRPERRYEIRLKGHLDTRWSEWLEGLSMTHDADGTTVLVGTITDQAALHGVLARLRDLGVTLISLNELDGGTR